MSNINDGFSEKIKNNISEFILKKFELGDEKQAEDFCDELMNYITSSRRAKSSFENDVENSIKTLSELNYSLNDIIRMISLSELNYSLNDIIRMISLTPTILHLNKNDLFWRYLLFEKIIDTKTGLSIRNELIIEKPQFFRTSQEILYARIKYLESEEGKSYRRKKDYLTVKQIIKTSHKEFEDSYHIAKDELLKKYPFDNAAQLEVIEWPENKSFLSSIYEKGTSK